MSPKKKAKELKMGLIGLAIGKAHVKVRERMTKKAAKKGGSEYAEAKKAEKEAKRKFEQYKRFEDKVYGTLAGGLIVAIASPAYAVSGAKFLASKIKDKKAQRKAERDKETQEQKQYESEKEIAEACAKIIENAISAESLTPRTPTGNNRNKVARELLSQKGLNPDSMATVFGKRIKHISTFNADANVLFVVYIDDEDKKHYAFLEKNHETGNFHQLADLTSEKAQQRIVDAVKVYNTKLAERKKEANVQSASRLRERQ